MATRTTRKSVTYKTRSHVVRKTTTRTVSVRRRRK